jgi:hypothetical protein
MIKIQLEPLYKEFPDYTRIWIENMTMNKFCSIDLRRPAVLKTLNLDDENLVTFYDKFFNSAYVIDTEFNYFISSTNRIIIPEMMEFL